VIGKCYCKVLSSFPKWNSCRLVIGLSTGPKVSNSNIIQRTFRTFTSGKQYRSFITYRIIED
jgi:hypothetical protein